MQNRAFLPTRLRNKEYCFYVGWGTLREKKMDRKNEQAYRLLILLILRKCIIDFKYKFSHTCIFSHRFDFS